MATRDSVRVEFESLDTQGLAAELATSTGRSSRGAKCAGARRGPPLRGAAGADPHRRAASTLTGSVTGYTSRTDRL